MSQFTFKLNDLSPKLREQAERKLGIRNTNTPSNLEQDTVDEPMAEKAHVRFNTPVRVHFHSFRRRLCDIDGVSGKAALDAIVRKGTILEDDSPLFVKEVTHSQEKCEKGEMERTIITITPV